MTSATKQAPGRIDADAATAFLDFLGDALGVFAFQTYDDDKDRKDPSREKPTSARSMNAAANWSQRTVTAAPSM